MLGRGRVVPGVPSALWAGQTAPPTHPPSGEATPSSGCCAPPAGCVQFLQYYYQRGCLYRLRALGERNHLDLTVGESLAPGSGGTSAGPSPLPQTSPLPPHSGSTCQ